MEGFRQIFYKYISAMIENKPCKTHNGKIVGLQLQKETKYKIKCN